MRKFVAGMLFSAFLAAWGCSEAPQAPEAQLATISSMLSKGYEMTASQRSDIESRVGQARQLLETGKEGEASLLLNSVITDLRLLAETDRFNKSE